MKLGFGSSPRPRYVNLNRQYPDCLWYYWKSAENKHEPIFSEAITGYLKKIEIKEGEHRGKENNKLNLTINCDEESYVLVVGIETETCKSLVNSLASCTVDFSETPICITPIAGDSENVLFVRVYTGMDLVLTESRINAVDAIAIIMQKLGQSPEIQKAPVTKPQSNPIAPPVADVSKFPITQLQRQELIKLSKDMHWEKDAIVAYLKTLGYQHSSQIPSGAFLSVCDGLRDRDVWESFHQAVYPGLPLGDWEQAG